MQCLLFIFTVCVLNRFTNGAQFLEHSTPAVDEEYVDDRIRDSGKDTMEINDAEGDASSDEDSTHEKPSEVESDSSKSVQDVQALQNPKSSKESDQKRKEIFEEIMKRFQSEMAAGDTADLIGQNPHITQDHIYSDLSRRFVPQYTEEFEKNIQANQDNDIKPEKAPPELVLVVAKESALLGPDKQYDMGSDVDRKKILRSGDYWNGVWKEDVNVKSALRSNPQQKSLGTVKAKIKPGSEFYKVVSRMKNISPRLLYIINKKQL